MPSKKSKQKWLDIRTKTSKELIRSTVATINILFAEQTEIINKILNEKSLDLYSKSTSVKDLEKHLANLESNLSTLTDLANGENSILDKIIDKKKAEIEEALEASIRDENTAVPMFLPMKTNPNGEDLIGDKWKNLQGKNSNKTEWSGELHGLKKDVMQEVDKYMASAKTDMSTACAELKNEATKIRENNLKGVFIKLRDSIENLHERQETFLHAFLKTVTFGLYSKHIEKKERTLTDGKDKIKDLLNEITKENNKDNPVPKEDAQTDHNATDKDEDKKEGANDKGNIEKTTVAKTEEKPEYDNISKYTF